MRMKITTLILREIAAEELKKVLEENSKQLKMHGSTFSPKKFPGPPEYQKKIDNLLDNEDPQMAEQGKFLLSTIASEEEAELYINSRERAASLDDNPGLLSSKIAAKDMQKNLNNLLADSDAEISVRSFASAARVKLGGKSNYDLIIMMTVPIEGYSMDQSQKPEKYKNIKRNLPTEQVEKIENAKQKLVDIFAAKGYKLEIAALNYGGGENVDLNLSVEGESEFSGTYQVNAKEAKPIEL